MSKLREMYYDIYAEEPDVTKVVRNKVTRRLRHIRKQTELIKPRKDTFCYMNLPWRDGDCEVDHSAGVVVEISEENALHIMDKCLEFCVFIDEECDNSIEQTIRLPWYWDDTRENCPELDVNVGYENEYVFAPNSTKVDRSKLSEGDLVLKCREDGYPLEFYRYGDDDYFDIPYEFYYQVYRKWPRLMPDSFDGAPLEHAAAIYASGSLYGRKVQFKGQVADGVFKWKCGRNTYYRTQTVGNEIQVFYCSDSLKDSGFISDRFSVDSVG